MSKSIIFFINLIIKINFMKSIIIAVFFLITPLFGISQNANELYIKGVQSFDQKKFNDALNYLNQAIEKSPDFNEAYLKRGVIFLIFKDFKKAIFDFDKAIKLGSVNELAFYNRGIAERNIGELNPAIIDFTKAISMNPDFGLAYFNRALTKLSLDDFTGACPDLSRAADLGIETATEIYKYNCMK